MKVHKAVMNAREDIHQRSVDDNFAGINETGLADGAMLAVMLFVAFMVLVVTLTATFAVEMPGKHSPAHVRIE